MTAASPASPARAPRRIGGARLLAASATALLASSAATAVAQDRDVVLRLKGSGVEIAGQLLRMEQNRFVITTGGFGTMRVDATRFSCTGRGCPGASAGAAIAGADASGNSGTGARARQTLVIAGTPAASRVILGQPTALPSTALPSAALASPGSLVVAAGAGSGAVPAAAVGPIASPGASLVPAPVAVERIAMRDLGGVAGELAAPLIERFAAIEGGSVRTRVAIGGARGFEVRGRDGRITAILEIAAGSEAGVRALLDGQAQVLATAGELDASERALLVSRLEHRERVIALDPLVALVSPDRAEQPLPRAQLADILAGRVTDWSQLGKAPGPLNLHIGGIADGFATNLLLPLERTVSAKAIRHRSEIALADTVANTGNAIGLTSLAFERSARLARLSEVCGLIAAPSIATAKTEEYPLARRVSFHTLGVVPGSWLARFLDFAVSNDAQPAIRQAQFVDQSIERLSQPESAVEVRAGDADPEQARRFVASVAGGTRLSLAFRFALGSAALDARGQQDLVRLRAFLATPEMQGRDILLAGFADVQGGLNANRRVAQRRALQVRAALLGGSGGARLGTDAASRITALGYGASNGIACNTDEAGRRLNRRVEVWVLDGDEAAGTAIASRGDGVASPAQSTLAPPTLTSSLTPSLGPPPAKRVASPARRTTLAPVEARRSIRR